MPQTIAIVDCNNFYVSCERVFQPRIEKLPVVILSNNDGCAVARSDEAKAIGIKMGQPYFQFKHLEKKYNIQVFSSNYALYGDMSARMAVILEQFSDNIEIYSIDEAFLNLTEFKHLSLAEYGKEICDTIKQQIGLPVSVGISTTKTLAKLANYYVKKNKQSSKGVFDLTSENTQNWLLPQIGIENIWGIGSRWAAKLKAYDIETAQDLKQANKTWVRKQFSVVMLRTVCELNNEACFDFEQEPAPKKEIVCSRSFGTLQTEWQSIRAAVSHHAANAAAKLRKQNSVCAGVYVCIRTNPFSKLDSQYGNGSYQKLLQATDDTSVILKYAMNGLKQVYKQGYRYKKAGIMLYDISSNKMQQLSLFEPNLKQNPELMKALDTINARYGKGALQYGSEITGKGWQMANSNLTPSYTTKWSDIPIVKAK